MEAAGVHRRCAAPHPRPATSSSIDRPVLVAALIAVCVGRHRPGCPRRGPAVRRAAAGPVGVRGPGLDPALALALGVHGLAGRAAEQIIWDQVGESVRWVRRSRKFTAYVPSDSPFPKSDQEPYINSPVPEAIQVAGRLRAGAEEQTSDLPSVFSFLITLMESGGHLIERPH